MHGSTYREMEKFAALLPATPLSIADVGSMDINGTYKPLFAKPGWKYTGLDIGAGRNVDRVLESPYKWGNVADEEFDVVISGQALEHTEFPWIFAKELARIVKRGGDVCVIAPYQWEYHAFPIDCYRFFPDGMRAILTQAGLTVVNCFMAENSPDPRWKGDTVGIARRPK